MRRHWIRSLSRDPSATLESDSRDSRKVVNQLLISLGQDNGLRHLIVISRAQAWAKSLEILGFLLVGIPLSASLWTTKESREFPTVAGTA